MCLNHLSWRLSLSTLNNWKMKNTNITQIKQGSNTSMCLAQLIWTFTFFDDISTAPRHFMIPKCHLHASLYPHSPPCWTLPWKKNKLCFQHVNVDLEPFYPQKHQYHFRLPKNMEVLGRANKKFDSKELRASCNLSAEGLSHRFEKWNPGNPRWNHPQEIVLFAQVDMMLIAQKYFCCKLFRTSSRRFGAPNNSE